MGKTGLGALLMIASGAALAYVYTLRPPADLGEVVHLAAKGQDYIKEPYYQVALAVGSVVALIGVVLFLVGLTRGK